MSWLLAESLNSVPELVLKVQLPHVLGNRLARLVLPQEVVDRVEGFGVAGRHDEVAGCGRGPALPLVDASQGMRQMGESVEVRSSVKFRHLFKNVGRLYRATQHVGSNLPLTPKQKFRFGLACPDLARPKQNFCFDVNGRFEVSCCVTLYSMTKLGFLLV